VDRTAKRIDGAKSAKQQSAAASPAAWAEEGLTIAKKEIYTFGEANGSLDHPVPVPASYQVHARKVAQARAALAGRRLAAILNARFR